MSSFQALLLFPWSICVCVCVYIDIYIKKNKIAKFSLKDSSKDFSLTKVATKFHKFSSLEIVSSLKIIPSLQSTFPTMPCGQKAKFII